MGKNFDAADGFCRVHIDRSAESALIPEQKTIVVTDNAAGRKWDGASPWINGFRRMGYPIVVQGFKNL